MGNIQNIQKIFHELNNNNNFKKYIYQKNHQKFLDNNNRLLSSYIFNNNNFSSHKIIHNESYQNFCIKENIYSKMKKNYIIFSDEKLMHNGHKRIKNMYQNGRKEIKNYIRGEKGTLKKYIFENIFILGFIFIVGLI